MSCCLQSKGSVYFPTKKKRRSRVKILFKRRRTKSVTVYQVIFEIVLYLRGNPRIRQMKILMQVRKSLNKKKIKSSYEFTDAGFYLAAALYFLFIYCSWKFTEYLKIVCKIWKTNLSLNSLKKETNLN